MFDPQFLSLLSLALALVVAVYNLFLLPSRSDRKELERKVSKLELDDASHEVRLVNFCLQLEKIADHTTDRFGRVEGQLSEVGRMREDLASVKTKLEGYGATIIQMNTKIDRMYELLISRK